MTRFSRRSTFNATAGLAIIGLLSACTTMSGGENTGGGGLAPALTARMDTPSASLDRAGALNLINSYRATVGASALASDPSLDATAQSLADTYAASGQAPKTPAGLVAIRLSAGYPTFADTFSGWRSSPADAGVLASRGARRGGIAVAYNASSNYGVYWVLVLDE